jgi:hypothetical protein
VRVWVRSAVACSLAAGLASCGAGANVGSGSAPHVAGPLVLVGEQDGVRLTVRLDRDVVAPGGRVRGDVRIENRTGREIRYSEAPCAAGGLAIGTSMSLTPGRRWPGQLGAFKDAALSAAQLPTRSFTNLPGVVPVCAAVAIAPGNRALAPQAVLTRTLFWDADIAPGAPARPGTVVVDASFTALQQRVDVHGSIRIAGRDPHTPSPGEIVDAVLTGFADTVLTSPPTMSWLDGAWAVTVCCPAPIGRAVTVGVDARTGAVVSVSP